MEKNGNLGHLELIRKINRTLILNDGQGETAD